jgi:uncharacterized RDD family membrane protein YckC
VALRAIALFLDTVLVSAAVCLIFFRLVSPTGLDTIDQQVQLWQQQYKQTQAAGKMPDLQMTDECQDLMASLSGTAFAVLMCYFIGSEVVWGGATLGKRVFGLRVARWPAGEPPTAIEILSRNTLKSVSLLFWLQCWLPLLMVELLPLCLRRTRRTAHDYLARTIVTGDAPPPSEASHHLDDE